MREDRGPGRAPRGARGRRPQAEACLLLRRLPEESERRFRRSFLSGGAVRGAAKGAASRAVRWLAPTHPRAPLGRSRRAGALGGPCRALLADDPPTLSESGPSKRIPRTGHGGRVSGRAAPNGSLPGHPGLNCSFLPECRRPRPFFLFPSSLERQRPGLGKRGADLNPSARSVTCKDRAQLLNRTPRGRRLRAPYQS